MEIIYNNKGPYVKLGAFIAYDWLINLISYTDTPSNPSVY